MFYEKVKANYRIVSDVVDIKTGKPITDIPKPPIGMKPPKEPKEPKMAEAGFDLTDFNSKDDFKKILKLAGVKGDKVVKDAKSQAFVWNGAGIKIYTGADPIKGIKFNGDDTGEEAYASYIGLSGTSEMVKKVFDAIKKIANYKDANPTEREFI